MTDPGSVFCCTVVLCCTSAFLWREQASMFVNVQNPGVRRLKTNQRVPRLGDTDTESRVGAEVSADCDLLFLACPTSFPSTFPSWYLQCRHPALKPSTAGGRKSSWQVSASGWERGHHPPLLTPWPPSASGRMRGEGGAENKDWEFLAQKLSQRLKFVSQPVFLWISSWVEFCCWSLQKQLETEPQGASVCISGKTRSCSS